MTVLPRRRDEIGEPVQELKRREFDDAIGSRPCGLTPAAGPDPGGGFVPREHVTDAGDPAVWAADHGESLKGEGGAGAVSEKMLKTPKIALHIAIDERDPDACIDREPAVLPGKHVGGGSDVEESLHAEPPHDTTAYLLGE